MTSANGNPGNSVIKLKSVAKVFLTDEVETHARSDVSLDVAKGEYVSIGGPSGCGGQAVQDGLLHRRRRLPRPGPERVLAVQGHARLGDDPRGPAPVRPSAGRHE